MFKYFIQVTRFIKDLSKTFPCRTCADDFHEHIKQTPITAKSREELSQWMCGAHNHVNERLGKPLFDCSNVDLRWKYSFEHGNSSKNDANR